MSKSIVVTDGVRKYRLVMEGGLESVTFAKIKRYLSKSTGADPSQHVLRFDASASTEGPAAASSLPPIPDEVRGADIGLYDGAVLHLSIAAPAAAMPATTVNPKATAAANRNSSRSASIVGQQAPPLPAASNAGYAAHFSRQHSSSNAHAGQGTASQVQATHLQQKQQLYPQQQAALPLNISRTVSDQFASPPPPVPALPSRLPAPAPNPTRHAVGAAPPHDGISSSSGSNNTAGIANQSYTYAAGRAEGGHHFFPTSAAAGGGPSPSQSLQARYGDEAEALATEGRGGGGSRGPQSSHSNPCGGALGDGGVYRELSTSPAATRTTSSLQPPPSSSAAAESAHPYHSVQTRGLDFSGALTAGSANVGGPGGMLSPRGFHGLSAASAQGNSGESGAHNVSAHPQRGGFSQPAALVTSSVPPTAPSSAPVAVSGGGAQQRAAAFGALIDAAVVAAGAPTSRDNNPPPSSSAASASAAILSPHPTTSHRTTSNTISSSSNSSKGKRSCF